MTAPLIPRIMPGGEPFWFDGGDVGVLCVHGLTATPHEVRWFGEHLHAQGFTVHAPRLAGHGTNYMDLERAHWQDWYTSALDGYHALKTRCKRVVVAGLSMGGLLTLLLAQQVPLDAIVVMAAPLHINAPLLAHASKIKYFKRTFNSHDPSDLSVTIRTEQLARGEPNYGRVRYERMPTQTYQDIYDLMQVVNPLLPEITMPACIIYARNDKTVPFDNYQLMVDGLQNADVETHILEKSGHVMTHDIEKEAVFEIVTQFVKAHVT